MADPIQELYSRYTSLPRNLTIQDEELANKLADFRADQQDAVLAMQLPPKEG